MNAISRTKEHILQTLAKALVSLDVTADEVTLSGFIIGIWAFLMLPYHHYTTGIVFICLNRMTYLLDKRIAYLTKTTDKGFYLRTVLNYIFCAGFFFFFAMGFDKHLLMTGLIIFSYSIAYNAKIALKLIIERRMSIERLPSRIRLGGMLSDLETFIVMMIICFWPQSFAIVGTIFIAQCWISIIGHLIVAGRVLNAEK